MAEEKVVLVNEQDEVQGLMNKLEAHQKGLLHRAISVTIKNKNGELLIQKRAASKYHWPNIWSNTTCTHPRDGESYLDAAHRRLKEEMGFDTELTYEFDFIYKVRDNQTGLTEHELDHVFIGTYDGEVKPNPEEVGDHKWIAPAELLSEIAYHPNKYSFWFRIILDELQKRSLL